MISARQSDEWWDVGSNVTKALTVPKTLVAWGNKVSVFPDISLIKFYLALNGYIIFISSN